MTPAAVSNLSWTLLGIVVSGLFLGHGMLLAVLSPWSPALALAGIGALIYALLSYLLLVLAWLRPGPVAALAGDVLGLAFGAFVLALAWRVDTVRSAEWGIGLVVIAVLLLANRTAARRVGARRAGAP